MRAAAGVSPLIATRSSTPPQYHRERGVLLVGSSGGGTATLGHTDGISLIQTIDQHLQAAVVGARLVQVLYVEADQSMDGIDETTARASLITFYDGGTDGSDTRRPCRLKRTHVGQTLETINHHIQNVQQQQIVKYIMDGRIQGIISMSSKVDLFSSVWQTLRVMEESRKGLPPTIPVTGSGGSSLARLSSVYGIKLTGNAGGSVATTTWTRAVSYSIALGKAWQQHEEEIFGAGQSPHLLAYYRPLDVRPEQAAHGPHAPQWTSILNACLPAFWAVHLSHFVLSSCLQYLDQFERIYSVLVADKLITFSLIPIELHLQSMKEFLEHWTLPIVCAVVSSTAAASLGNSSASAAPSAAATTVSSFLMASLVAVSVTQAEDSILMGLIIGHLVAWFIPRIILMSIWCNLPATMTSLLTAGGVGAVLGLVVAPLAPLLRRLTQAGRISMYSLLLDSNNCPQMENSIWWTSPAAVAFVVGVASCYGSKVGYYHSIHLPLILLELELGRGPSFLGAVDELSLVLVCAGVCAGKLAQRYLLEGSPNEDKSPRAQADQEICSRGLWMNVMCGDFVEACYPYMEESQLINVAGYLASGFSCAHFVYFGQCTAYCTEAEEDGVVSRDCTWAAPGSLAYLPWPFALLLAGNSRFAMLGASLWAFCIPFLVTLAITKRPGSAKSVKKSKSKTKKGD